MTKELNTLGKAENQSHNFTDEEILEAFQNKLTPKSRMSANNRVTGAKISIVNHKNGKRIKISNEILAALNAETGDFLDITVTKKSVLIKKAEEIGFKISSKNLIYSKELVDEITREFSFNFENQSTHHLSTCNVKQLNEQQLAIVQL